MIEQSIDLPHYFGTCDPLLPRIERKRHSEGLGNATFESNVCCDRTVFDAAAARTLYEQALAIFRELGDRWGIAGTLADLGSLAREEGNYPAARSLYRESIKIFQELDHKRGIARLLECFACSAAVQLEAKRSLRLAGAAAALRQNIGAPLTPAEQAKLEACLHPARQALTNAVGVTAWLERATSAITNMSRGRALPRAWFSCVDATAGISPNKSPACINSILPAAVIGWCHLPCGGGSPAG